MRWLSWLLKQISYAALVPVPSAVPAPAGFIGRTSADDCEAFLAGRLAEYRMDHHQFVSVSDWTNLLAHGSEADLRSEVSETNDIRSRTSKSRGDAVWREARWYLTARLLHQVTGEGALENLQRLVLVPLELELAAGAMDWGPRKWVTEVDTALARHQQKQLHADHRDPHTPT